MVQAPQVQAVPAPDPRRLVAGATGRATMALVGGFAVLAVWLLGGWGGPETKKAVTDIGQLLAALAATAAAGTTWRRCSGPRRRAWGALTIAVAAWAAGEAAWCYYELLAARDTPFPSLADAGFLLFPPAAMLGLWWYPSGAGARARTRLLLDACTLAASLLLISWVTVLGVVYHGGADNGFAFAVSLAYPVGDLALLTVAVLVLTGGTGHRLPLLLMGAGMAAMAVSDSAFTYLTATDAYRSGGLTDLGWPAAFVLIAVAALAERRGRSGTAEPVRTTSLSRPALLVPYAALLLAAGIGGVQLLTGQRLDLVEQANLALLLLLVFVRQAVTLAENSQLIRAVAAREEELHHQAFHDPLTGLANRALFSNRLEHAVELHRRDARPLSVLLLDLDDFKAVNDTLGHPAGDELLLRVAERLRGCLRSADTIARLGGDEFAVLLEAGSEPPEVVAGRVVTSFGQPFQLAAGVVRVGSSIGLAADTPETAGLSAEDIMRDADVAMYTAKRGGKGHLAVFTSAMRSLEGDDLALRRDLAAAVESGDLQVAYQPIRHTTTGELWGVEAVASWHHTTLGEIPAQRLRPLVEAAGLATVTDDLTLRLACAQLAQWLKARPGTPVSLCVGISADRLTDGDYPTAVAATLRQYGIPPERLVLQIEEAAVMADPPATLTGTTALHALGVRVAIDHFGSGPSSLSYLDRLPIDYAILDESFTRRATSAGGGAVLRALADMCVALNVTPISRGIRTPAEHSAVGAAGLRLGQGPAAGDSGLPVDVVEVRPRAAASWPAG